MTHSYDRDLDIYLKAPTIQVELSTDNGGSGAGYTNTVFDDSATTLVTAGSAPLPELTNRKVYYQLQRSFHAWRLDFGYYR